MNHLFLPRLHAIALFSIIIVQYRCIHAKDDRWRLGVLQGSDEQIVEHLAELLNTAEGKCLEESFHSMRKSKSSCAQQVSIRSISLELINPTRMSTGTIRKESQNLHDISVIGRSLLLLGIVPNLRSMIENREMLSR